MTIIVRLVSHCKNCYAKICEKEQTHTHIKTEQMCIFHWYVANDPIFFSLSVIVRAFLVNSPLSMANFVFFSSFSSFVSALSCGILALSLFVCGMKARAIAQFNIVYTMCHVERVQRIFFRLFFHYFESINISLHVTAMSPTSYNFFLLFSTLNSECPLT